MSAEIIPNPVCLAQRVTGTDDGLTVEQMLVQADEALERAVCRWHDAAVRDASFMSGSWDHSGQSPADVAATAMCFAAIAGSMRADAGQLGFPEVAAAAQVLVDMLLRLDTTAGLSDRDAAAVAAALRQLERRLGEPRRVVADGGDLLAA